MEFSNIAFSDQHLITFLPCSKCQRSVVAEMCPFQWSTVDVAVQLIAHVVDRVYAIYSGVRCGALTRILVIFPIEQTMFELPSLGHRVCFLPVSVASEASLAMTEAIVCVLHEVEVASDD